MAGRIEGKRTLDAEPLGNVAEQIVDRVLVCVAGRCKDYGLLAKRRQVTREAQRALHRTAAGERRELEHDE